MEMAEFPGIGAPVGLNDEAAVRWLLESPHAVEGGVQRAKVIAVVGLSDNPDRPSYRVAQHMQSLGYRIVPVGPKGEHILGEPVYRSLPEIPFAVDVVDVFRAPDFVPGVLEDVKRMQHKPRIFWLQEGVVHAEAAADAQAYGLHVVMDRCPWKEHDRLHGRKH
ncbi:MAG TPA: CoA-binding protein [Symbiobacteriaceae bacterium]|nr:CoA-binding protein [Symbiobacteriaceae bacterium]